MKKLKLIIVIAFMAVAATSFGQSAEVLYFKANLACCRARACNQLESNLKSIVENNFSNDEVSFRRVKIANEANKSLVRKFNAKSQTVVVITGKNKKEKSLDISGIVARYRNSRDKKAAEKEIVDKIKSIL